MQDKPARACTAAVNSVRDAVVLLATVLFFMAMMVLFSGYASAGDPMRDLERGAAQVTREVQSETRQATTSARQEYRQQTRKAERAARKAEMRAKGLVNSARGWFK